MFQTRQTIGRFVSLLIETVTIKWTRDTIELTENIADCPY